MKLLSKSLVAIVFSSLMPMSALAESATPAWMEPYFTIEDIEVTSGPLETLDVSSPFAILNDCDPDYNRFGFAEDFLDTVDVIEPAVGKVEVIVDKIINIGSKLWEIVVSNAPVVDINMPPANALPAGTMCWNQLENWEAPKSREYEVNYKNGWGMNIVKFKYRVVYTAGGSYDGTGRYLANVRVFPATLNVAWGFNFNAEASIGNLVNLGTTQDPEAGMEVAIRWRVKTPLNDTQTTENFFIRGNGEMTEL